MMNIIADFLFFMVLIICIIAKMKNKIEERVTGHPFLISESPFFIPKIHVEIKLKKFRNFEERQASI